MTSRPSTAAPIVAMLTFVLVMLAAYFAGYYWLGDYVPWSSGQGATRVYRHPVLAGIYAPAGKIEALMRDEVVETNYFKD